MSSSGRRTTKNRLDINAGRLHHSLPTDQVPSYGPCFIASVFTCCLTPLWAAPTPSVTTIVGVPHHDRKGCSSLNRGTFVLPVQAVQTLSDAIIARPERQRKHIVNVDRESHYRGPDADYDIELLRIRSPEWPNWRVISEVSDGRLS